MLFRSSSLLIATVVAAASTVLADNTAHDSCTETLDSTAKDGSLTDWIPADGNAGRPTTLRCCKGFYGDSDEYYGRCDTSSCVENFDAKNRNCFNYGSPEHPSPLSDHDMENYGDDPAGKGGNGNGGSHICPYKKLDKAICDTSFYTEYNEKNCRLSTVKGGDTHCLGRVKCQSAGLVRVDQTDKNSGYIVKNDNGSTGTQSHSDGTDGSVYDFAAAAIDRAAYEANYYGSCTSPEFPAGSDCFYDGGSENWKVCKGDEVDETDGGGGGDPHMLTWGGTYYDYMGICDLVLVDAPGFGNGVGFTAHIRTASQAKDNWSYIESAAIQIADDVLEVGSYGEIIWNGVALANATEVFNDAKFAGKYKIEFEQKNKKERLVTVYLSTEEEPSDTTLTIRSWKQMVNVKFNNAMEHDFKDSVGMMGDFYEGILLGRDGVTVFTDENEFGQEWQVKPEEPMLFNSRPELEGKKCQLPTMLEVATMNEKRLRRRLSETGVNQEAAELACAKFKGDRKEMCIYDVIATGDLEAAEGGAF